MKTIFRTTLLAAAIATVSTHAFAINGAVDFQGEFIANACVIAQESKDQLVDLKKHAISSFTNIGSMAGGTNFELKLTDCPSTLTSASARFSGDTDGNNVDALKVTSDIPAETATGVAIQLIDANNSKLNLHTNSMPYPIVNNKATLKFSARYIKTLDVMTAGKANGKADFSITYN